MTSTSQGHAPAGSRCTRSRRRFGSPRCLQPGTPGQSSPRWTGACWRPRAAPRIHYTGPRCRLPPARLNPPCTAP
eukprot:350259-Chlamydomonas_euryale.AAC.1